MNKEKQIEEMAKVIDEYTEPLSARDIHKAEFSERFAEALYNAGYRKTSDVAREIFEEITKCAKHKWERQESGVYDITAWEISILDIAKLKKKYESEATE